MKQWIKRLRNVVGKAIGVVPALLCFGTATALADSINLSEVTADTTVADGTMLTGKLGANIKITIADGAEVTLAGGDLLDLPARDVLLHDLGETGYNSPSRCLGLPAAHRVSFRVCGKAELYAMCAAGQSVISKSSLAFCTRRRV